MKYDREVTTVTDILEALNKFDNKEEIIEAIKSSLYDIETDYHTEELFRQELDKYKAKEEELREFCDNELFSPYVLEEITRTLNDFEKLKAENTKLKEHLKRTHQIMTEMNEEIAKLQQDKEKLIKWLEDEDENLWATATDGHKFIKNLSLIERRTTLREILSKLKESDNK